VYVLRGGFSFMYYLVCRLRKKSGESDRDYCLALDD